MARTSSAFSAAPVQSLASAGVVKEIHVHGNHTTPDADVLAIAGAAIGVPATDERLAEMQAALEASGRFASVDVRRRYLSIDDPTAIVVVIVVSELDGVSDDVLVPGPLRRLTGAGMWLPVLEYEDGYGFTYGARVSLVDALGAGSRLSVPLTWGGERQAVLELDRPLSRGPIGRIGASVGIRRRENPHYEIGDTRRLAEVRAERTFKTWLRGSVGGRVESVSFGERDVSQWTGGATVTLDTRLDPAFPRNAIFARASWESLQSEDRSIGRWSSALEGYVGLSRFGVLALRTEAAGAASGLPPWEQALLGGRSTLRGYRLGYRAGDNLAAASAELRVPLTSPLRVGRFGVRGFVDTGTTWNDGEAAKRTEWDRGIGAGVFLNATIFSASLDVAWPESDGPRWHLGLGVRF